MSAPSIHFKSEVSGTDFPPASRARVIINTDAANEADDQFAIVYALLTQSFELHGLIAAHFGQHPGRPQDSQAESRREIEHLLRLMDLTDRTTVKDGAKIAMPDELTPRPSDGAELIINHALSDDLRPLNLLFLGPLTDLASALLLEPQIANCNLRVVWIGGADQPTHYGPEFNLTNDVHAANVVMRSTLAVSQIPYPLYGHFCVSHEELLDKVRPHGKIGCYLVEQLVRLNRSSTSLAIEHRSLGDSPAIGVTMAPHAGCWHWEHAPMYDPVTSPRLDSVDLREIRVYDTFDARFLFEDFYAKITRFARSQV